MVALVLFAVPPLLTNAYVGMREVDRGVVRGRPGHGDDRPAAAVPRGTAPVAAAAARQGADRRRPALVATATLAALAGGGGLGRIITAGFNLASTPQVVAGALLVAGFALVVGGSSETAERLAPAWAQGGR